MKKVFFAAVTAAIVLIGCNGGASSDDPKVVLMAFFDALKAKDMKKAKELATPESAQMLGLMEMGMNEAKADAKDEFDKSKMDFGTPVIDGDKAKVPVTNKDKKETVSFPMKKIDGKWKVAFDKTSMMEMATEKAGEKGINLQDTVNAAMKEMQKMDMDSLQREINQAMDTTGKQ